MIARCIDYAAVARVSNSILNNERQLLLYILFLVSLLPIKYLTYIIVLSINCCCYQIPNKLNLYLY